MTQQDTKHLNQKRRSFIKASAFGGALGLAGISPLALAKTGRVIKLGYVTPQTGALAGFGEVDRFILAGIQDLL